MSARKIIAIALSGALVACGAGIAIAAVTKDDAKRQEQAILDDAAKRLNVDSEKLREALAAAQDAQLDEAVENGDITRKQADAIMQRRKQSGRVLGGGPFGGPERGPYLERGFIPRGGPFGGPRGEILADTAKALGITRAELHERLHDGKTIAAIAKAEGKSVDSVRTAVKAAAKERLDKAVQDGDITRKQADAMLERFDAKLERFDQWLPPRRAGRWRSHHHGPPLPGSVGPGSLHPWDAPPELTPPRVPVPG